MKIRLYLDAKELDENARNEFNKLNNFEYDANDFFGKYGSFQSELLIDKIDLNHFSKFLIEFAFDSERSCESMFRRYQEHVDAGKYIPFFGLIFTYFGSGFGFVDMQEVEYLALDFERYSKLGMPTELPLRDGMGFYRDAYSKVRDFLKKANNKSRLVYFK